VTQFSTKAALEQEQGHWQWREWGSWRRERTGWFIPIPVAMVRRACLGDKALLAWAHLARYARPGNPSVRVFPAGLCEALQVSRRQLRRVLSELKKAGLLEHLEGGRSQCVRLRVPGGTPLVDWKRSLRTRRWVKVPPQLVADPALSGVLKRVWIVVAYDVSRHGRLSPRRCARALKVGPEYCSQSLLQSLEELGFLAVLNRERGEWNAALLFREQTFRSEPGSLLGAGRHLAGTWYATSQGVTLELQGPPDGLAAWEAAALETTRNRSRERLFRTWRLARGTRARFQPRGLLSLIAPRGEEFYVPAPGPELQGDIEAEGRFAMRWGDLPLLRGWVSLAPIDEEPQVHPRDGLLVATVAQ